MPVLKSLSLRWGLLLSVLFFTPSAAFADGTHLLGEGHIGVALPLGGETDAVGLSTGVTGGFGGRLAGTPLRLYLIGEFNYSDFSITREGPLGELLSLHRALIDVEAGGRAMVPVGSTHVRLFADFLIGFSWLERETPHRDGQQVVISRSYDRSPRFALFTAIGLQFRPIELFSVGVKADFGFMLDDDELDYSNDDYDEISGRLNLVGTATLPF